MGTFDQEFRNNFQVVGGTVEPLLTALLAHLKAHEGKFTAAALPALRTIDINYGQTEQPEAFETFMPALFIAWDRTPQNDGGGDLLQLELSLLQDPTGPTTANSPGISKGFEYLRVLEMVKYLVLKFEVEGFAPLDYGGERSVPTEYGRFHTISYGCRMLPQQTSVNGKEYGEAEVSGFDVGA